MMAKWHFARGRNLSDEGFNDPAINEFYDTIGESLTREVIQNSVDAFDKDLGENVPVVIKFSTFEIEVRDIPDIKSIINDSIPKAKDFWINKNKDTYEYICEVEKCLSKKKIDVLKVSDYNTTGLNEDNIQALIFGNNYSCKTSVDAAGSKGIGKAAPFAASDLRMVFYNTVSKLDGEQSAGVINFVSYNPDSYDKEIVTQRRGFYCSYHKECIKEQLAFDNQKRGENEFGTDLYIIGLKDFEDLKYTILKEVLNNFLVSIYKGYLRIEIFGEEINKDSINKFITKLSLKKISKKEKLQIECIKNYYEVLKSDSSKRFNLPKNFVEKYHFVENEDDAYLTILDIEESNRKILQTRKVGMKIYERGNISGIINFTGVLIVNGKRLNEFLRSMENIKHDLWNSDRFKGSDKRLANEFLKDLRKWYVSSVEESYGTSAETKIDAIGVRDLLPIKDGDENISSNSGIRNSFKEIQKIKKIGSLNLAADGDKLDDEIDEDSYLLGEEKRVVGNKKNKIKKSILDGIFKGKSSDSDLNESWKILYNNIPTLKLIETDYIEGRYKIVGKLEKRGHKKLGIEFKSIGDNGRSYRLEVEKMKSSINNIKLTDGKIEIFDFPKSKKIDINIDFKIKSSIRQKMEVGIYEIKK